MSNLPLTLHNAVYSDRNPKEVIAYSKDTEYHLYDLQLSAKTFSVYLSMQEGKNVAICVEDEFLFLVAFIGCLYAKKTPILSGCCNRHTLFIDDTDYDILVGDSDFGELNRPFIDARDILAVNPVKTVNEIPDVNKDAKLTRELDDSLEIVFYTSGSTGKSKKIVKTLKNMETEAHGIELVASKFAGTDNLMLVGTVPCTHTYGMTFRVFMPLLRRIPVYTSIVHLTEELCSFDKNIILVSSPALISRFDTKLNPPKIVAAISAGSSLSDKDAITFKNWTGCSVTEIYGSTETNVMAIRDNDGTDRRFIPAPGVSFKEINGSMYLFSNFVDKKVKIDDKLDINEDGIKVLGRQDRIVKIEERRISLTQIEQRAKDLEEVTDAVCVLVSNSYRKCVGIAVSVTEDFYSKLTKETKKDLAQKIKNHIKQFVYPNAVPRYVRIVDKIPVNEMGKKVYQTIEALFND